MQLSCILTFKTDLRLLKYKDSLFEFPSITKKLRHGPDLCLCRIEAEKIEELKCQKNTGDKSKKSGKLIIEGKFIQKISLDTKLLGYNEISKETEMYILLKNQSLSKILKVKNNYRKIFQTEIKQEITDLLQTSVAVYSNGILQVGNEEIPMSKCMGNTCLDCAKNFDLDCTFKNNKCQAETARSIDYFQTCDLKNVGREDPSGQFRLIATSKFDKLTYPTSQWTDSNGAVLPSLSTNDKYMVLLPNPYHENLVTLELTPTDRTYETVQFVYDVTEKDIFGPVKKVDFSMCENFLSKENLQCEDRLDRILHLKNDVQEALHTCGVNLKSVKVEFDRKVVELGNQFDNHSQKLIEEQDKYAVLTKVNKGLETEIALLKRQIIELESQMTSCDAHIVNYQQKIQSSQREMDDLFCADPLLFFSGYILASLIIFIVCLVKFIRFKITSRAAAKRKARDIEVHSNMEKIEIPSDQSLPNSAPGSHRGTLGVKVNSLGMKTPSPVPRRTTSRRVTPQITPRSEEEHSLIQSNLTSKRGSSNKVTENIIL